jgi:hypothetical protein
MAVSQNKTEYFFGIFGLFLFARKALCTFGMLEVALSGDSVGYLKPQNDWIV